MHIDQGDERRGDQQFIGDGVQQDSESGHLEPASREVTVRPICRRCQKQHEHTPNLEVHLEAPQLEVWAAR